MTGASHTWSSSEFHTYGGILVTSSVTPYGHYDSNVASYTNYYPMSNMFSDGAPNVNSVYASANSEGQLTFDLPTKVYVEYLRIYPYCGDGHSRYVESYLSLDW